MSDHKAEAEATPGSAYERLIADPRQLQCEVVVCHRIGFHSPDDLDSMDADEITYADSILERYVQSRIAQAIIAADLGVTE